MATNPFRSFKISPEIILLGVMTYVRFPLSVRNGQNLLHERRIEIYRDSVHLWTDRGIVEADHIATI